MGEKMGNSVNRKLVMFPSDDGQWGNHHLLKEIGLIPYHMYQELGYESILLSRDRGPYDYLNKFLNGLQMEFIPTGALEERINYVIDYAKNIDLLMMTGAFHDNLYVAMTYRQLRPDGKIWLQLDMNVAFADYLFAENPELAEFGNICDLITVASRRLQDYLNLKWTWKVYYFPHTYLDSLFNYANVDYTRKKNVILTVGRLGNWQKGTDVLLEAFAKVASILPEWELRLIGRVEDNFLPWIEDYFNRFSELKGRVLFLGQIDDKAKLIHEYEEAKVFAFPSRMEGGMANSMIEAMRAGCAMLVTQFEAYDEAIGYGVAGMASEIDDIDAFAENMVSICLSSELESMCNNSCEYAKEHFDCRKNVRVVDELLFGDRYDKN